MPATVTRPLPPYAEGTSRDGDAIAAVTDLRLWREAIVQTRSARLEGPVAIPDPPFHTVGLLVTDAHGATRLVTWSEIRLVHPTEVVVMDETRF